MSEQNTGKKKSNKLLIVVIILLLAICCALVYMLASGKFPSGIAKSEKEYTTRLGEFVVNLADQSPTYIKATITIGYTDKKGDDVITKKLPQIKDCINKFMLSKTSKDFKSDTIESSGEQLLQKINQNIGRDLIKDIYFEQIIIQ